MEEKQENYKAVVRKWEILVATKVKMSDIIIVSYLHCKL